MVRNFFLILFLIQNSILFSQHALSNSIVARVDGESVTLNELKLCEHKCKASVILEFKNKFGLCYDTDFWNKVIHGNSPAEVLRVKALNEAIDIKIQQLLARDMGLIKDIGYAAFITDLNTKNLLRKQDFLDHKVIYGPEQYTEENYYEYLNNNLILSLKQELNRRKVFDITDKKLHLFYENVKDSLYKLPDLIEVKRIEVHCLIRKSENIKNKQKDSNLLINSIQEQLLKTGFNEVEFNRSFKSICNLKSETKRFDPLNHQNMEGEESAEVLKQVEKTNTGKFSSITYTSDGFLFYQLIQRKKMGYSTFEAVKNSIKTNYISSIYKNYISNLRKNSIIEQY